MTLFLASSTIIIPITEAKQFSTHAQTWSSNKKQWKIWRTSSFMTRDFTKRYEIEKASKEVSAKTHRLLDETRIVISAFQNK